MHHFGFWGPPLPGVVFFFCRRPLWGSPGASRGGMTPPPQGLTPFFPPPHATVRARGRAGPEKINQPGVPSSFFPFERPGSAKKTRGGPGLFWGIFFKNGGFAANPNAKIPWQGCRGFLADLGRIQCGAGLSSLPRPHVIFRAFLLGGFFPLGKFPGKPFGQPQEGGGGWKFFKPPAPPSVFGKKFYDPPVTPRPQNPPQKPRGNPGG